jgi:hypothetical protein
MTKRLKITLVTGAILGIICILGATVRSTETLSTAYLFAFWFNRLLMGFVFGLMGTKLPLSKRLIRGAIVGLAVSFAFYSATEFYDLIGFLVGAVYGLILEFVAYKLDK